MIANLPLLFAGGNPTCLAKMLTNELECFITFLVHCSWGHDTAKHIQQPQWWPSNVTFSDPFTRPKELPNDWATLLRDLIKQCYVYHNSEFLLKFSEELARNPPATLQYVDNCDRTTSLYLRSSGRLLVTFRNENMLYDRKVDVTSRICLLPKKLIKNAPESIVEHIIADIYLCDTCDDVFDNFEDLRKHERVCSQRSTTPDASSLITEPCQKQELEQDEFMNILGLQAKGSSLAVTASSSRQELGPDQVNHRQRRTTVFSYLACFPFSSLAGQRVNKSRGRTKEADARYRDHMDRYCAAPALCVETPKWLHKTRSHNYPVKYKKTENYWNRQHIFPKQRNRKLLDVNSQLLLFECKPVCVKLTAMRPEEIKQYLDDLEQQKTLKKAKCEIEFVSVTPCDSKTKQTSGKESCFLGARRSGRAPSITLPKVNANVTNIDIIDLCSDDEDSLVAAPCPVACHASGEVTSPCVPLAATPGHDHSTEPDSLEAAHYPSAVKRRPPFSNSSQQTKFFEKKISKRNQVKEFHINLYSPKISNVISID